MTVAQKIGLALQEARARADLPVSAVEARLTQRFHVCSGSLSDWERGESLPPSETVLYLLNLYRADIYLFMLHCGLEELSQIGSGE